MTMKKTIVINKKNTNGRVYVKALNREDQLIRIIDHPKHVEEKEICKIRRIGNGPRVW